MDGYVVAAAPKKLPFGRVCGQGRASSRMDEYVVEAVPRELAHRRVCSRGRGFRALGVLFLSALCCVAGGRGTAEALPEISGALSEGRLVVAIVIVNDLELLTAHALLLPPPLSPSASLSLSLSRSLSPTSPLARAGRGGWHT